MLFRFLFVFLLVGCATTIGTNRNALKLKDIDLPVSELRSIIGSILPAGQRAISPNGRELLSKHFVPEGASDFKAAGDAPERFYASFLILGDRRPYDIEILVTREKRTLRANQFIYTVIAYDRRLAKELETKLRDELTKRREDRNIIDDFRVF